jgi:hypothetical protein
VADLPSKWTSFTPAHPVKKSNERRIVLFVIYYPDSNAYFKPKNAFEGTCFFKATLVNQNRLFYKNSYQNFFVLFVQLGIYRFQFQKYYVYWIRRISWLRRTSTAYTKCHIGQSNKKIAQIGRHLHSW